MILTRQEQGNLLKAGMIISFKILPGSFIYRDEDFKRRMEESRWFVKRTYVTSFGPRFQFENMGPLNPYPNEGYTDPFCNIGSSYHVVIRDHDLVLSNKGRKECWQCGCNTEQRRDFSDMSIREFCPRCKI